MQLDEIGPPPRWVQEEAEKADGGSPEALIDAAVAIACRSADRGHGPFGAVLADEQGQVVSAGFNHVVAAHDSTAHAEIEAIRRAQHELGTHDLSAPTRTPLTLYSSCEPCIMCFGAIYWSGLARLVAAAPASTAEAIGFMEGPVTDEMWAIAREDKGIERETDVTGERDPEEPFRIYEAVDGVIY